MKRSDFHQAQQLVEYEDWLARDLALLTIAESAHDAVGAIQFIDGYAEVGARLLQGSDALGTRQPLDSKAHFEMSEKIRKLLRDFLEHEVGTLRAKLKTLGVKPDDER